MTSDLIKIATNVFFLLFPSPFFREWRRGARKKPPSKRSIDSGYRSTIASPMTGTSLNTFRSSIIPGPVHCRRERSFYRDAGRVTAYYITPDGRPF